MGLDMYLREEVYIGGKWSNNSDDELVTLNIIGNDISKNVTHKLPLKKISFVTLEVGYWRKANQIHKWFIDNCSIDSVDDCKPLYVSYEQLEELREICKKVLANHDLAEKLLPVQQGFFFGDTEYDKWYFTQLEDTVEIINGLDLSDSNYNDFYYCASW